MKRIRIKNLWLATLLMAGAAFTACSSDDNAAEVPIDEPISFTSTRIMLTAEGMGDDTTGTPVLWENGDKVRINGKAYDVTVEGDDAYIDGEVDYQEKNGLFAVSPYSGVMIPQYEETGDDFKKARVSIPASYTYTATDGRQKIDLPMVAYTYDPSQSIDELYFQHITAAVSVTVNNTGTENLIIDEIELSNDKQYLSGYEEMKVYHDNVVFTGMFGEKEKAVTMNMGGYSLSSNKAVEAKIPVVPGFAAPSGANYNSNTAATSLTITIRAHTTGGKRYICKHTDSIAEGALARNKMLTASCSIPGDDTTDDTPAGNVTLSSISESTFTAQDGGVLSGKIRDEESYRLRVKIAAGATVTLSDVGCDYDNDQALELYCMGDATIILLGDNTIQARNEEGFDCPGIYIKEGYTLTIREDATHPGGSLVVNPVHDGQYQTGAGIGGAYGLSCGNITIESGTITIESTNVTQN